MYIQYLVWNSDGHLGPYGGIGHTAEREFLLKFPPWYVYDGLFPSESIWLVPGTGQDD